MISPISSNNKYLTPSNDKYKFILDELKQVLTQNSATAVYFNKVDVQHIDTSVQTSIINGKPLESESLHVEYPDILFFDSAWELIKPSKWYVKLTTECLNLSEKDVLGKFTGNFSVIRCKKRGNVYKPEIEAGSYNPYKKMTIARQSSSRRMKVLTYFDKVSNKSLSLLQTIITMPKDISRDLFNDVGGKNKFHKITRLFIKKFEVFLQGHAKVSKDFQIGVWLNEHIWSSKIPLNEHLHGHLCYPNILVNKKTQKIVRFKPFFSKKQMYSIKDLWKESIKEILGDYEDLNKDINIYHNYAKEKSRKLHVLKYCTRSWLHDLGKYFNNCDSPKDDIRFSEYYGWMKERFKKFDNWGAIENRTYPLGFLHNTKKIFVAHDVYYDFKYNSTKFCDVCGSEHQSQERIEGFPKIPKLAILMGHKSHYRMLGVFERGCSKDGRT